MEEATNESVRMEKSTKETVRMKEFATESTALLIKSQSDTPAVANIKSDALIGLRGLASLHILIFHALETNPLHLQILGPMQMPLFFLLSGYSLSLAYGRTTYDGYTSCCCTDTVQSNEDQRVMFKSFNFYRNRFARIMPIYYLSNFIIALPLIYFGHGRINLADDDVIRKFITAIIDSLVPIGMILPDLLWPFVTAGWTISTLWFFYLLFPIVLPKFQKYTDEDASRWTVILFWIQMLGGIALFTILALKHLSWPWLLTAYWVSTGWGLSRLPVFLMGVYAGLLRLRRYNNPNIRHRSGALHFIYAWLPWNCRCLGQESIDQEDNELATQKKWATLVNAVSISHVFLIIAFGIAGSLVKYPNLGWLVNWAMQFISVHSLLTVIEGLTRDGEMSLLSKICNLRLTQEIGRISMTLYLIHWPLLNWIGVAYKGKLNHKTPVNDNYNPSFPHTHTIIPFWGIPVIIIASPIIAWVLTKYVEEPFRELIRVSKSKS